MEARMMSERAMMSVSDVYRGLIPSEQGTPLDEQIYPWSYEGFQKKSAEKPLSMEEADLKTIVFLLAMQAVETQNWMDYHSFARMVTDERFKKLLNSIAWAEQAHVMKISSLLPPAQDPIGVLLIGEITAVLGYNIWIENEPNSAVKEAFQHIVQDHKEHARYAVQQAKTAGLDVSKLISGLDFSGARLYKEQFMKPDDAAWQGHFDGVYKKGSVDPQTLVNVDVALAAERWAWHAYQCAATFEQNTNLAFDFRAISSVENQHVSILSSLKDPTESILERAIVHEKAEMQLFGMLKDSESNPVVRQAYQQLYKEDLEQARLFGDIA